MRPPDCMEYIVCLRIAPPDSCHLPSPPILARESQRPAMQGSGVQGTGTFKGPWVQHQCDFLPAKLYIVIKKLSLGNKLECNLRAWDIKLDVNIQPL